MSLSPAQVRRVKYKIRDLKNGLAKAKKDYEAEKKFCREHSGDPTGKFDPDPCSEATQLLLANARSWESQLEFFQDILDGKIDLEQEISKHRLLIIETNEKIRELQEKHLGHEIRLTNLVSASEIIS